jgi:hypothetical protein
LLVAAALCVAASACGPKESPTGGKVPTFGSWAVALGTGGFATGSAVAVDDAGNIVVGGSFDTSIELGGTSMTSAGADDAFIAKLGPDGAPMWSIALGSEGADKVSALAFAPDGTIIAAVAFSGGVTVAGRQLVARGAPDAVIASLDPNTGEARWALQITSTEYVRISDVAVGADGVIALSGMFAGTARVGDQVLTTAGAGDALIAAIAPDGGPRWAVRGGAAYADAANAVAITDDAIAVTGGFTLRAEFAGTPLEGTGRHANQDVFIASYTRDGALRWAASHGGIAHDAGLSLETDGKTLFVGGAFGISMTFGGEVLVARGGNDAFVAAFDGDGAHQWSTRIGGEGSEDAYHMWLDGDAVTVGGTFELDGAFGADDLSTAGRTDIFVARVADRGAATSAWSAGGSGHDSLGGLAARSGGVVFTGSFADSGTFAGTTLTAGGERSAFVAYTAP